ncbi:MAG: DMT family transporter [Desulfohalobiaceae bacterium]|nr:DMT family transporter [Desulfohalobiaceae bacterium]
MAHWYLFSLAALLLIGLQRFLYKVTAASGLSPGLTTLSFMATVAVLSSAIFLAAGVRIASFSFLLLISLLNSLTFVTATLAHIQALKHVSAGVAYPLIRLNIILVVLFSVIFLGEELAPRQWIGVIASLTAMVVLTRLQVPERPGRGFSISGGLGLIFLAMLAGALSSISCKFAAVYTSKTAFIAVSYIFSTFFSLIFHARMFPGQKPAGNRKKGIWLGVGMGLLNLAGFYAYLQALSLGPLSLVASINGLHFVVAVVLSGLIYRERLQRSGLLGIGLTILSIFLLRS